MNFLEQLVAEWYEYHENCFVSTNVRFGKRGNGGWNGEMDVLAVNLSEKTLWHIETSNDAASWDKRKTRMKQKFRLRDKDYLDIPELKGFKPNKIYRIAVLGTTNAITDDVKEKFKMIELLSAPELIQKITTLMKNLHKESIPEKFPLLRTIQYTFWYGKSKRKTKSD